MSVLTDIIAGVREDLALRKSEVTVPQLAERIRGIDAPRDPMQVMAAPGLSVIAEVKRKSPSKGDLAEISDPAGLAHAYELGGAAAVSVLTEQRRFSGSLTDLDAVRDRVSLPILRKDFMIDDYQILEARAHGADIILLIVAALEDVQLHDFHQIATELGMRVLVEVHEEDEVERALRLDPALIGVNARNLKTLEVHPEMFARLARLIPAGPLKVAESGIGGVADAQRYVDEGADVVLVGESLVKDGAPRDAVRRLSGLKRSGV
ncbi:MAG: indole-3-glycerol phosphate synthase TrpC [Nocardioidaceae bacterium]|nr:indole-3-glycerol phosphate synthase TrpC [Nocardioidaceae bacterium]